MIRIVALISFLTLNTVYAQVGINTETPDPSAALEINSTKKGLLIPRMTMVQKDSIPSPANGLMVYQTDTLVGLYYYQDGWIPLVGKDYLDKKITMLQDQIDKIKAFIRSGTLIDQNGNKYAYLTYGEQVWTVENAKMETYRDGTPIPQVTNAAEWANLTTGAWCYYNNDPTKGKLYNWYAVAGIHDNDENTPNKELAPEGWHIPSDTEWTELENYLTVNGYNYDGTKTGNKIAKAMASNAGWNVSNIDGAPGYNQVENNSSKFNAFPHGTRTDAGSFSYEGDIADFWSSAVDDTSPAYNRNIRNFNTLPHYKAFSLNRDYDGGNKKYGISVRLIKD